VMAMEHLSQMAFALSQIVIAASDYLATLGIWLAVVIVAFYYYHRARPTRMNLRKPRRAPAEPTNLKQS
jgi:hypothetical protein